ncbi:Glutathione S-transferase P [Galdieria sulphuraria]|nr:Glutathione S-transferase P [Galdieria sulphuraria]
MATCYKLVYFPMEIIPKENWRAYRDAAKEFTLAQSGAIARFLARKYNLYGCSEKEMAMCDMVYETVRDIFEVYDAFILDSQRASKEKKFYMDISQRLNNLEKFVQYQNADYSVCNTPTFADYWLEEQLDYLLRIKSSILHGRNALQRVYHNMRSRPNIEAYLKSERRIDKPVPVDDA